MTWFPLGVIVGLVVGVIIGAHLRISIIEADAPVTSSQSKSPKSQRVAKRA